MNKLICAFLFASLTFVSCAQQTKMDKDKERINTVCDKFMQNFRDDKIPEALKILKENSEVIANSAINNLQETITDQMNTMLSCCGKILSYDFILERKIKDYLAKRFYILKLEKYYMKFDFTLYKSSTGWTITNFNYNQDLIEVLY
jgi:hypothetical protein